MQIFNANLDILGRLRARRFPFQENVLNVQVDATLDPGASPTTGDRYIISNSAALHANFGTITGVGDDDIVEYTGSAFEVMWDASAEGGGAQSYNEAASSFYIFDGSSWAASASVDERTKVSANDTTSKYLENAIVASSGSNTTNILEISTLNDGGDEDLQVQIDESKINHDNLTGFVANEHIDHSSVSISGGSGISGGGDITASRSLSLDVNSLTAAAVAAADELAFADASDTSNMKKVTFANLEGALNHDSLSGFVANEHIDHSGVSVVAGSDDGLSVTNNDLTSNIGLSVDISGTTAETLVADGDKVMIQDASAGALRSMTRADLIGSASISMESAFNISLSGGGEVLGLPATPSATGATSKEYVDGLVSGLQDFRESVLDKDLLTPPGSPTAGDRYLIGVNPGATATGAWLGHEGEIAEYDGAAWVFEAQPDSGTYVHMDDENAAYIFNNNVFASGTWVVFNSLNLVGGDGLSLSGSTLSADLKTSGGLKIDATQLAVEPADFAGTGLEDDGSDNLQLSAQGNGIAGGAGSTLSVDPATEVAGSRASVYVGADGVGVDVDNSTIDHSSSVLQVKAGGIGSSQLATGVLSRYSAVIGGSTAVAVNHALGLTTASACHITMVEVSSGCVVHPDSFTFTDGNNLTVNFATAPSAASIRINITSAEDIV